MQAKEITRYKDQLQEMRSRLIKEFRGMGEAVAENVKSAGDLSDVPTHPADRDSEGVETKIALEKTEGEVLNHVNAALDRIDAGTFGRCENCSAEISPERLDAIPYTPYCVRCEAKREREASVR
ncbi:MAG: TraR/DksA C4-type zinc finger protein [Pirellulaceae bacterium]